MEHFREHNNYLQGLYHNRTYYDLLMMVINEPTIPSARLLGLGLKLYPSNLQLMLNKDLTRFMPNLLFRAQLFEGRLALNPGFFFLCSKAFSRIIFCAIFRASNHQL